MEPKFHVVHELGCRTHIQAMVNNTMDPNCCMCQPKEDCSFNDIVERMSKQIRKEIDVVNNVKDPEKDAQADLDGNLYRKENK